MMPRLWPARGCRAYRLRARGMVIALAGLEGRAAGKLIARRRHMADDGA